MCSADKNPENAKKQASSGKFNLLVSSSFKNTIMR